MQGLECECEDISMDSVEFGPKCSSPRSWDDKDCDACCHSASTSDSQQSEGKAVPAHDHNPWHLAAHVLVAFSSTWPLPSSQECNQDYGRVADELNVRIQAPASCCPSECSAMTLTQAARRRTAPSWILAPCQTHPHPQVSLWCLMPALPHPYQHLTWGPCGILHSPQQMPRPSRSYKKPSAVLQTRNKSSVSDFCASGLFVQ